METEVAKYVHSGVIDEPETPGPLMAPPEMTEPTQVDYFDFDVTVKTMLPDGRSWVEHSALNEGQRRRYLNSVNREVKFKRSDNTAVINSAPGDDRFALLKAAICNWNLVRGGEPLPFNSTNLDAFLGAANPVIIDLIEADVRLNNAWLIEEKSIEDIDASIVELQKERAIKTNEEAGKVG